MDISCARSLKFWLTMVTLPGVVCAHLYCPSAADLVVAYSNPNAPQIFDQGWTTVGGGAVATRSAFYLLGGSVEFDADLSQALPGVNANIYSISPKFNASSFVQDMYCDGAAPADANWCLEVDYIESNGNCGGQTTLHDIPGPGSNGCTAWGCANSYHYNGHSSFHMRIEFALDGTWTTFRDGQMIGPSQLSPSPQQSDWATVKQFLSNEGAVIYSSQWVGWVPVSDCGSNGNLAGSKMSIKNLVINGTVAQGPTPSLC